MSGERDTGQAALPVVVGMLVVVMVTLLVVGHVSSAIGDRARARTAADAAALAGAHDGEAAARAFATYNGAELTTFEQVGDEVEVTVAVGGIQASARARLETVPPVAVDGSPVEEPVR
jgi:outer membrane lipoprotein SlyB